MGYVSQSDGLDPKPARSSAVPAGAHELCNAAAIIADQKLITTYCKWYLPNYGVFDESRYFHPGRRLPLIRLRGHGGRESTFVRMSGCRKVRPVSRRQQAPKSS